jgi:hypothetical protein
MASPTLFFYGASTRSTGTSMSKVYKEFYEIYNEIRKEKPNKYIYVGYPANVIPPIDVLLVLKCPALPPEEEDELYEELGEKLRRKFEKPTDFEKSVERMKYWYGVNEEKEFLYKGFHQLCIHKILKWLDKTGKKWVFTDLVKYYVENNNFKSAAESCIQYLKRQIEILQPRVVLMFGSDVQRLIEEHLVANRDKRLRHNWHKRKNHKDKNRYNLHGKIIEVKPKDLKNLKVKITLMYSVFPTGRNADPWVEAGGEKKLFKIFRNCLGTRVPKRRRFTSLPPRGI